MRFCFLTAPPILKFNLSRSQESRLYIFHIAVIIMNHHCIGIPTYSSMYHCIWIWYAYIRIQVQLIIIQYHCSIPLDMGRNSGNKSAEHSKWHLASEICDLSISHLYPADSPFIDWYLLLDVSRPLYSGISAFILLLSTSWLLGEYLNWFFVVQKFDHWHSNSWHCSSNMKASPLILFFFLFSFHIYS